MARRISEARQSKEALAEYAAKRNFDVTSEPANDASAKPSPEAPTFVVHKHDATRLHYDIRLEIDGALASWACPKGPSFDPATKRLAVETEDHPLAYGAFEGRIPDGQYGAGDSIIWDRGTYDTLPPGQAHAQREKGHLHVVFHGEKLNGGWHLVRTHGRGASKPQWLCFKAKDGTEKPGFDVVSERPESVTSGRRVTRGPTRLKVLRAPHADPASLLEKVWPPMLATLAETPAAPSAEFVYEAKYDGFRALAAISGKQLAVRSRNGLDFLERFPFLHRALEQLVVGEAVLDAEIIAVDAKGRSTFQHIGDAALEQQLAVFDLLWLEGEDLRERPLEERRELLESLLAGAKPPLIIAERVEGDEASALAHAKKLDWEGLIAKRRGAPYSGKRSGDWLKLKLRKTAELAIVGFTPHSNSDSQVGALLLGARGESGLVFAGKVGTGFDLKMRTKLFTLLSKDQVKERPVEGAPKFRDAVWVKPRHIAQLALVEWTRDGKLRHPAFQGLREDKQMTEVDAPGGSDGPVASADAAAAPAAVAPKARATAAPPRATVARASARPAPSAAAATKTFGVWNSNRAAHAAGPTETVPLTHGDRVLFPKSGETKADVRAWYDAAAPLLVRALNARPLSMQQYPHGIGGQGFFRHDAKGAPAWVTKATVKHETRPISHIIVDRPETLSWLANQSALTLHMPASRVTDLEHADWVVFDLDPVGDDWVQLAPIAKALHGLLEELKLGSVPKTSGKRGLHVLVPLAQGHTHARVHAFAAAVVKVLAEKFPTLCTADRPLAKRKGRLYLDAEQNGRLKTIVSPYSIRAVEGAPVSTPLEWDEIHPAFEPSRFSITTLPARLAKRGDLFALALSGRGQLAALKG